MSSLKQALGAAAESLAQLLDGVFADLAALSAAAAGALAASAPSRSTLESLRPVVERIVLAQDGLVESAGVSVVSGLLADAETWHQWWSLVGGKVVFVPHNLNPASVNFYDYTEMTWFQGPLASGRPKLVGPYIDFGGAFDRKVVTAAQPVLRDGRAAAVAGADLSMDHLERAFLRKLGRRDEDVALITETGKVVASNSARFAPGTRFEGPRAGLRSVPIPAAALASPPWLLIVAG
ncbi:cache domain-containing protein [Sinomonas sp. ASV486]|uniref:cache domain-containing protein n=1 Tax=Sinomonas sp. ASV486 TaxID=3051170 RepID=UPI0027DAC38F|nr:cache domain-containing protein [Sinomonas sp. ASV486]MDQ4491878.1 cache domain-containing protein [Sinomonas sp. ASV486]